MERKTSEARPEAYGLSLPIYDRLSFKEKLREERNKEYNVFLQNQAQTRRLKRGTLLATSNVQVSDASAASPLSILTSHTNMTPVHGEGSQRRDAATQTAMENRKSMSTVDPNPQWRRRTQRHSPKEPYSSGEELMKDKDQELEFRQRQRKERHAPEPEYNEEWRAREHKINRAPHDITEPETPGIHHHNNNNNNWIWKADPQMPDDMRATTRTGPATSKEKAKFATGLQIGTIEDPFACHMRKEMYKQELLKQIAEQQKNKMKEKKLELRVAATGASDPEKEPERINQQQDSRRQDVSYKSGIALKARGNDRERPKDNKFTEHTEQGGPQGRSEVDSSPALSQLAGRRVHGSVTGAPQGVSPSDYFTEDYHRNFSNMLGEMAIPRVASVPPPAPPAVTNNYMTPYDAAYYYYGTRNLLDPPLPHYQNGVPRGVQQSETLHSHLQRPPPLRPSDLTETDQHETASLDAGRVLVDKVKQRTETVLSYQEALKEQIREREESKKREKEEEERYDAKIEADMMAYNPWGRSGGGAPIKDQKGNLLSDLNQMHKINEESYRNPALRNSATTTPRLQGPSVFEGFSDQSNPQKLYVQNTYTEALKQQIEEKRRKQTEEREQRRIEEEKDEKRLAKEMACMQQQYEEDQRRQKKSEHRLEKQSCTPEPKTLRQEKERMTKQEQTLERRVPEGARDTEEKKPELSYKRELSPPIPTLQKKQTHIVSRASSVASRRSTGAVGPSEHSESAPLCRPAPQQQDDQQEVIRELSAIRQCLQKEMSQVAAQLGKKDRQEGHYTPTSRRRGRAGAGASESSQKQTDQTSAGANVENIREFNQLKHRDTASREELLRMYPDPPTDAQSLDAQQRVLLREQRRRMRREEEHDPSSQHLSRYHPGSKPGRFLHRDLMLPSETTFIDVYSSRPYEEQVRPQKAHQPSAERQQRTATWRTQDYDEAEISMNRREPRVQPDAQTSTSLNGEAKVPVSNQQHTVGDSHTSEQNAKSEVASGDEVDITSLCSALERRISMDTVATEPWLRPGTSDAGKCSADRARPNGRTDAPPWLAHGTT